MAKFNTEVRLSREMKLMDVTLIGVGAMIGAGIFVLTGIAAGVAGPALIVAFSLNGLVALLTAMSYAELGSCYHDAGGGYLWVKEGLPRWNGFISGWMSWFAHAVACSLYALGFGAYFDMVLTDLGLPLPSIPFLSSQKLLAVLVAMVLAYVNYRGASETGKIGNFVTMAKIAILAVFVAFGISFMVNKGDVMASFTPFLANGWGGVVKAMGLTFIAFQGFEVISQCSEEVQNPRRNIPRAVFLSLLIVVPIYLLVAVVSLGSVAPESGAPWDYLALHKETALVEVAKSFFVGGGIMLLVGGVISTISALNATIYSSSRVAYAMGRDRNFPTIFSHVSAKRFTPHWSILFSAAIVIIISISLPIEDVASAADIMFLLLFMQVNVAMIKLRKQRPDLDRGFITPFYPYITILAIVLLLILAVFMFAFSPIAWLLVALWVAAGLLMYKGYASHREVEYKQKVSALERIDRKEYRILVALPDTEMLESLVHVALALALAQKFNAEILFLHVFEVPEHEPLASAQALAQDRDELIARAMAESSASGSKTRGMIKLSHRLSEGIVETAREEECNVILIGREQHPTFLGRVFSSAVDKVLQHAPCEVAVLHGTFRKDAVKRILLPFDQNVHTQLAFEFAQSYIDYFQAEAEVAVVMDPLSTEESRKQTRDLARESLVKAECRAGLRESIDMDVAQGVIDLAEGADLILMAGMTGGITEQMLKRSVARRITEDARCPVLWLKEYEEQPSFWQMVFKPSEERTSGS